MSCAHPPPTDLKDWTTWRCQACVALAPTDFGLVSVKLGDPARLIDKEANMAKKLTKTATSRNRKTVPVATTTAETKQSIVLTMLRRTNGASIAEIIEATDWQPHSVRGFMSGALKKRLSIDVISEKGEDGVRRYYVAPLKG